MSGTSRRLTRAEPGPPVRIVHLGAGAFFRAHQAWYTHRANAGLARDEQWGIAAFSGRGASSVADLAAQDGRYTLVVAGPQGRSHEVVESISEVHAGNDMSAWHRCFELPELAVVTLTVTEAGYRARRREGLDRDDPDVRADLGQLRQGEWADLRTAPARLLSGLRRRRDAGLPGVALVPCDNVAANGELLHGVLLEAAEDVDPTLARWVAEEVTVVGTAVDRITPRTSESDIAALAEATGRLDRACVVTEPYVEWVLQGDFPLGRPAWDGAGAQLVPDVRPYEDRKLRLLNGAHSMLAYLGPLVGHRTVDQAVADARVRAWVLRWWEEAVRHVRLPADDLAGYCRALLDRFANPGLRHELAQIATDGSHKLPLRTVSVVEAERAAGRSATAGALTLAAWTAHLRGRGVPVTDAAADSWRRELQGVPAPGAAAAVLSRLGAGDDRGLVDLVAGHLDVLEAGHLPEAPGRTRSATAS